MMFKKKALSVLLGFSLMASIQTWGFTPSVQAEGASDPAPLIIGKSGEPFTGKKILFDNAHANTAGDADAVIDGAFSDFANSLANMGFTVKELRKQTAISADDLEGYDIFITAGANTPFGSSEQELLSDFTQNGGSIFFISDHYNSDQNSNRWDPSEVYNGYRRGAWSDPYQGMTAEEIRSFSSDISSSDWLADNFGIRFRYNAIDHAVGETTLLTANQVISPDQALGITQGVSSVAIHGASTLVITDPVKAKGIVYLPSLTNRNTWPAAVDQGVYSSGGMDEGAYAAIAKIGYGKAAFLGDMSAAEDSTSKYLREDTGVTKNTSNGFNENDTAVLLKNIVAWLGTPEVKTSLDQYSGLGLDNPNPLLNMEDPLSSTETLPEPTVTPAPDYKWYDPSTFKPGSFGGSLKSASSSKIFTSFTWGGNAGTIDEINKTIHVVFPSDTDMNLNKKVTFEVSPGASVLYDGRTPMTSGASLLPPSVAPASLMVKAEDGTSVSYSLTMEKAAPPTPLSSEKAFTSFTWGGNAGTIDEINKTIHVVFPSDTDMDLNKKVTFEVSQGATVLYDGWTPMTSGTSLLPPSVAPASLMVKAEDGSSVSYSLTMEKAAPPAPLSSEKAITSLTWGGNAGTIDELRKEIQVTFPEGTDMSSEKPLTFAVSDKASVLYNEETPLISSANLIPHSYTLTVKAEDGSTVEYHLMPTLSITINLTVTPDSVSLVQGATQRITASIQSMNNTNDVSSSAIWSSEDESIATVDYGLVTAKSAGSTKISVTYQGITKKINVIVTNPTSSNENGTGGGGGGGVSNGNGNSSVPAPTGPSIPDQPAPTVPVPQPSTDHDIFNPNAVQADSHVVSSIQAKVDEAKKTAATGSLTDIRTHWAAKTIDTFAKLNVIKGYSDGTFQPDHEITRAEFAVIISRVFNLTGGSKDTYLTDVGTHWAKEAIGQLAKAGVISGYGDGTFRPENSISREEMVMILSRLVNMDKVQKDTSKGSFADINASYAKEQIQSAAQAGIISGISQSEFNPKVHATRAEALTTVLNTLNLNPQIKALLDSLQK